jgi:hypothetical protein
VNNNGPGYPFPSVDASDAYRPGRRPVFGFDVTPLQQVLRAEGMPRMSLSVCGPHVPMTISVSHAPDPGDHSQCVNWAEMPPGSAPRIMVAMRPSPIRWWGEIGLALLTVAALLTAFLVLVVSQTLSLGRRVAAVAFAVLALIAGVIGIGTGAAAQGDNLGVQGQLSGLPLTVATWAPLVVLPLTLAAVVLPAVSLVSRRPPRPAPALP